ncbi:hypothetical protein OPQ81_006338 [Rhizoctonia solani]|nr:hypothetical protein OPQ81_006338 [Rhizoctonia solani]
MIIRHFGFTFWLLPPYLISTCSAFSFVFSSQPSQCQSLTVQWTQGTGPYRLFLVPVGHVTPEVRSIVNMEIPAGQLSTNLDLALGEQAQYTQWHRGRPTACLQQPPRQIFICTPTTPRLHNAALIAFLGTLGGTSYDWTTNVREGTQMLFLAVGGNNENGGSTDITTIAGGSSGCINSQSPSSTASPAAGGISTIAQSATVAATGTNEDSMTSSPTATNTAGGTDGGSAHPTATATGDNGSPSTPTNSSNPSLSTTRGSGGGTVTGDPHLPAATGGLSDGDDRINLGAIIGGTLGGIALILFLIFMWLMCKHKRSKRKPEDKERLIAERRTDLLDDSFPVVTHDQNYEHDWFRTEPFVPPMSGDEFARRTGATPPGYQGQGDDYDYDQSRSSMDHGGVGLHGVIARSTSYSTSDHGHRSLHSHSRQASSHGHSRSLSNPHNFSFTPNSGSGRRDSTPLTPSTPMAAVDPIANPTPRPPPSSWHNHASTSANVVLRPRRSGSIHEQHSQEKSGIEDEGETYEATDMEGDIVDIPPSYESLRKPHVTNPDAED